MNDLVSSFHHSFEVLTGWDHKISDEAFKLRYQVYCLETGFESHAEFSDCRERDQFDCRAAHGVIRHRRSGTNVATVRLVLTQSGGLNTRFPIEHAYPQLLRQEGIDERLLPRGTTGEISRFAISKHFKRCMEDHEIKSSLRGHRYAYSSRYRYQWQHSLITFGLFLALVRLSRINRVTHWLAVMEPALLRLLGRYGIRFSPVGGLLEYHGKRQPCYGGVENVLRGIERAQLDLWRLITDNTQPSKPAASFEVRDPGLFSQHSYWPRAG